MSHEIESPVRRLTKSYANQAKDGPTMVDLIDSANGHPIARCVYEPYADEIIEACSSIKFVDRT